MTDPATTRIPTPPGSVLVLRFPEELHAEETLDAAEELHRQTGLPVVVVSGDTSLTATTPEEAEAALSGALDASEGSRGGDAAETLGHLREEGWELVRVREPE